MEFPSVTRSRKSLTILDLLVFTALAAVVMAEGQTPQARGLGVLTFILLVTGYLMWWLPGIDSRSKWVDGAVALAYLGLILISFLLYGIIFVVNPTTVLMIIVAQFLALMYISSRA